MSAKKILVTGATGKQGGALIDALLSPKSTTSPSPNFTLYGLTRNARSPRALALQAKNVTLIEGDTKQPAAIFTQTGPGIWGVFSVTVPGSDEEAQAKPLIDAAIAHGVQHFVFTSVDRGGPVRSESDDPTYVPHFITKFNIEKHLKEKTAAVSAAVTAAASPQRPMTWTILRPVAFFDNLTPDFIGRSFARMVQQLGPGVKLNMIGSADIGAAAARAFRDPEAHASKAYTLAADSLDFETMNRIFREEVGADVPLAPGFVASLVKFAVGDLGKMFRWFGEGGYSYDIGELKKQQPGMQDFRTWLRERSGFETRG